VKRTVKILAIILGVIAALLLGLTLFIKSYLTDERVRKLVLNAAEESLQRKVSAGKIDVGLFKGIVVEGLEIKEKDSTAVFAGVKEFVIRYQLLPLLSRRLVIDEIRLNGPVVRIAKKADGTFNFSDISKAEKPAEAGKQQAAAKELPVAPEIKTIVIKDGRIEYSDPSGGLRKAEIGVDAKLGITSASRKALSSEGTINIKLLSATTKDKTFKDLPVDAKYRIDVDLDGKKMTIASMDAHISGLSLSVKGSAGYGDEASLMLDVNMPETDVSKMSALTAGALPEGMALGGGLGAGLKIERKAAKDSPMSYNGRITMKALSVSYKGMKPVFNGAVAISPDAITLDNIRLSAGKSDAAVNGRIANYGKYPDIRIDLKSGNLDLGELFGSPQTGAQEQPAGKQTAKPEKDAGPIKLDMTATGTVQIANTQYKGIVIRNFNMRYELKDSVFRVPQLSGETLSGGFNLNSSVDLNKPGMQYTLNADIKGMKIDEIVDAFAPKAKGTISGMVYSKADISGAGTATETIRKNLRGKGNISIKNGILKNSAVSSQLLAVLGIQNLREIPMDKADAVFSIADRTVSTTGNISSKDLIIDEQGNIGLDETLDLGVRVKISDRLTPKIVGQSAVGQFLSEEKGWTAVPLRLTGSLSKPSYNVDTKAVGKKAVENLKKKVGDEIFKALPGKKETQSGKGSSTPGDLLKGIFGK